MSSGCSPKFNEGTVLPGWESLTKFFLSMVQEKEM